MKTPSFLSRPQSTNTAGSFSTPSAVPLLPRTTELSTARNHVLIADDQASVRDVSAKLLARAGFRVTSAPDGEAAWVALCADKIDVLITDQAMPSLTGLELIRRVRSGPLCLLPCVLISGKMPWAENDLLDLVRPGMALVKPFSFLELLTCIRGLLPLPTSARALDGRDSNDDWVLEPDIAWQDDARTRLPSRALPAEGSSIRSVDRSPHSRRTGSVRF